MLENETGFWMNKSENQKKVIFMVWIAVIEKFLIVFT